MKFGTLNDLERYKIMKGENTIETTRLLQTALKRKRELSEELDVDLIIFDSETGEEIKERKRKR